MTKYDPTPPQPKPLPLEIREAKIEALEWAYAQSRALPHEYDGEGDRLGRVLLAEISRLRAATK